MVLKKTTNSNTGVSNSSVNEQGAERTQHGADVGGGRGNPKPNYDFGELKNYKGYGPLEYRFKGHKYKPKRLITGLDELDQVLAGIPYGLTILLGAAGSGKSMLAKAVARNHITLYIVADSRSDGPDAPNVHVADYTQYIPNWNRALDEMFGLAKDIKAELIVVDSLTRFFSGTAKAVGEADLRPAAFKVKNMSDGRIPIIATSEIRKFNSPAGGEAIRHAGHLVMFFEKLRINSPWVAKRYNCDIGNIVWSTFIEKDTGGLAKQGQEFRMQYNDDHTWPILTPVIEHPKDTEGAGPRHESE